MDATGQAAAHGGPPRQSSETEKGKGLVSHLDRLYVEVTAHQRLDRVRGEVQLLGHAEDIVC